MLCSHTWPGLGEARHNQERLRGAMSSGGKKCRLWLNFSTPPEKRRRNILAKKLKRAILEAGGDKGALEAESATGSIWHRGKRVSGGGSSGHEGCITVGCGRGAALGDARCGLYDRLDSLKGSDPLTNLGSRCTSLPTV